MPEVKEKYTSIQHKHSTLGDDLFVEYKKRYLEKKEQVNGETRNWLSELATKLTNKFSNTKSPEKIEEPQYNELKLSLLAKEYLDSNRDQLIAERIRSKFPNSNHETPNEACIVIYLPGKGGEKSQAKKIWIPRINPKDEPVKASGFTLIPKPKSNGYNTEYSIKDDISGKEWTQLAILFPVDNPEYKKKASSKSKYAALARELSTEEVHLSKIPKTKKTADARDRYSKNIENLKNQITQLRSQIRESGNPGEFTYFSYIPYREGLNSSDNQKLGFDYLSNKLKKIYEHPVGTTSLGNIPSNIPGGPAISEVLPWQYPFILNIIERMDFMVYFDNTKSSAANLDLNIKEHRSEDVAKLMNSQLAKSLTTFGLNTSEAYNWQKSKVGAQGIAQIMPGTFHLFAKNKKYCDLFPNKDFDTASREHDTSFRLQIAHFDSQLGQFPTTIRKNWNVFMGNKDTGVGILSLLAAGYNGNMSRITNEVFGDIIRNPPKDENKLISLYQERLSPSRIKIAMKEALDNDIEKIKSSHEIRKVKNKNSTLSSEQIEKIKVRTATYKESMTYVLKAEYVWKYLNEKYGDKFTMT